MPEAICPCVGYAIHRFKLAAAHRQIASVDRDGLHSAIHFTPNLTLCTMRLSARDSFLLFA
jgi:hypothetical protein